MARLILSHNNAVHWTVQSQLCFDRIQELGSSNDIRMPIPCDRHIQVTKLLNRLVRKDVLASVTFGHSREPIAINASN